MKGLTHDERRALRKQIADACAAGKDAKTAAMEFGVSLSYVKAACYGHGVKFPRPPSPLQIISREQWDAMDWSMRDCDIAAILSVSRERVRQVRILRGEPKSSQKRKKRLGIKTEAWLLENRATVAGMTLTEIRRSMPFKVSATCVFRALNDAGMEYRKPMRLSEMVTRENIEKFIVVTQPAGCWEWVGGHRGPGYAGVGKEYGHRFVYELFNGPIPDGLWCLHKCDNPLCVNPEHLYAGTASDNARDRVERGRHHGPLPDADVIELRRLFGEGESIPSLSKRFDRSIPSIYDIIKGRTHRDRMNGAAR